MPSAIIDTPHTTVSTPHTELMRQSGSLDVFEQRICTPAIGAEFPNIDLVEVMDRPNADVILRDLSIMIAERGVIMFRDQKQLTTEKHKELIERISRLGGRPKECGLIKHALHAIYGDDSECASITPERLMLRFGFGGDDTHKRQNHAAEWHRDMSFETNPAALSSLRIEQLPLAGGDTMFASSYELYDRMSKPMQQFIETLSGSWQDADKSRSSGRAGVYKGPRGSPANIGFGTKVMHPAVRTHPTTGFKALYAYGTHFAGFNDVTPEENEMLIDMIERLLVRNHDLQARFDWRNTGDLLIWDNRCVMHSATMDTIGKRLGFRVLSAGEVPYFDAGSAGRQDARSTLKAQYDGLMEQIKSNGNEIEAKYINGKQINGKGELGVNAFPLKDVLAASHVRAGIRAV